mgnify:CR=1 FL=1
MKKMLQMQLKNVPEAERAQILEMVEKDPKLFEQIAKDIKQETKKGKDKMVAAALVLPKYQKQLRELMGPQKVIRQFNPNGSIRK